MLHTNAINTPAVPTCEYIADEQATGTAGNVVVRGTQFVTVRPLVSGGRKVDICGAKWSLKAQEMEYIKDTTSIFLGGVEREVVQLTFRT
jgi:hypothetical protein